MYRWHSTSTGMIPKTLGALSVENTGQREIAIGRIDEEVASGIEDSTPVEGDNPSPLLDLRGDAATAGPRRPPLPAYPPQSHGRSDHWATADQAVAQQPE
jgi:hypothetical protein